MDNGFCMKGSKPEKVLGVGKPKCVNIHIRADLDILIYPAICLSHNVTRKLHSNKLNKSDLLVLGCRAKKLVHTIYVDVTAN